MQLVDVCLVSVLELESESVTFREQSKAQFLHASEVSGYHLYD